MEAVAYLHGVVMRIFPNGHTNETRSIVVAISQSASSFNFSLTEMKHKIERLAVDVEDGLRTAWHKDRWKKLTQCSRVIGGFDSFCLHPGEQLGGRQFLHQIGRDDKTAIEIGGPCHADVVGNRW